MGQSGLVISQMYDVTVVRFQDASIHDLAAVEAIARQLYALVDEQDRRKILLDFRAVRFFSSQILGVLVRLQGKSAAIKGKVVLCGLQPELHRVFKITRLDTILQFAKNEQDAMGKLGASPGA